MSYGIATAIRIRTSLVLLALAVVLFAMSAAAGNASAAFTATGWSLTTTNTQAGSHPAVTLNAAIDPVKGDANGDDLSQLQIELPAGLLVNPQSVATPCTTTAFKADTCPAATQVGSITVSYRVAGKINTASGAVYSITPDSNSVINFGFVVRPSTSFQKFFFSSSRATGLTSVRQGPDKDYGLNILVPNIPRTIKSNLGTTTSMTISNIAITFNPRSGAAQTGSYFVFTPTRCDAATSRVTISSYQGASQQFASGYVPTGCDKPKLQPTYSVRSTNTAAGQATGIVATVTHDTADQAIQPTHIKDIRALLPTGSTVNLGVINSTGICSEAQLAVDTCPAAARIGTASVNVPFLPAPMSGEIYLTSRDPIQFAYIIRGARGTVATLRGSAGVDGGVVADFQTLPQVPWSSATLSFTSTMVNNPANSCPSATSWAYISGYTGSQYVYGTTYPQTNCPPDTTITSLDSSPYGTTTPSFSFGSTPAGATAYQCRIDNGYFAACTSPYVVPAQSEGTHTLYVRALSSAGTPDPTPATRQFTIDVTPPALMIDTPTEGQQLTSGTVTLNYTTEPGTTNYCRLDSGVIASCSSPQSYAGLTDGAHKIRVIVRDAANNLTYKDRLFTVQTAPPLSVTLNKPNDGQQLVTNELAADYTISGGTGSPIQSRVCTLFSTANADLGDVQEMQRIDPCTAGSKFGLDENSTYRVEIRVTDAAGATAVDSVKFTSGIMPPTSPLIVDSVSRGRLTNRLPKFELEPWDDRWPNALFECGIAVKGAQPTWSPCGSVRDSGSFQVTTPLTDGEWVFWYRSYDGPYVGFSGQMQFSVGDWDAIYAMTPSTTQAAAHPDLDISITPTKAGQLKSVDMTLPRGLIGSLNSGARCADAGVPTATCDVASQIGSVSVRYQIAGVFIARPALGEVYFTNPQVAGDAAGMVILVHSPIEPFANVIIPLRVQLVNNSQQLRVFSDTIPTVVGDIDDPEKFTQFWVNKFDMKIDGSKGTPHPLLTNPSSCAAANFSAAFGDKEGFKTPVQLIPFQATGCAGLPFAPAYTQSYSSTTAGQLTGLTADITVPAGNSSLRRAKVVQPPSLKVNTPALGTDADQCGPSTIKPDQTFDPTGCPSAALVGSVSITSPLLPRAVTGTVHLISASPLPSFGVYVNDAEFGLKLGFFGANSTPVDASCDPDITGFCDAQITTQFQTLPDLPSSTIRMVINGPSRTTASGGTLDGQLIRVANPTDRICIPNTEGYATFTPHSGTPTVQLATPLEITGCPTG